MIETLSKKNPCNCEELPCIHNQFIPEDRKLSFEVHGFTTKKGVKYFFIDKKMFEIVEESDTTMKVRIK